MLDDLTEKEHLFHFGICILCTYGDSMKKILLKGLMISPLMLGVIPLTSCGNKNENKITIAEVTHSMFYAPMYIAKNAGYFKDEGLDIDIITTPGADKVMAALLSKDAQIGLMGKSTKLERRIHYST